MSDRAIVHRWLHHIHRVRLKHRLRGHGGEAGASQWLNTLWPTVSPAVDCCASSFYQAVHEFRGDGCLPAAIEDLGGDPHLSALPLKIRWPDATWIYKPRSAWPEQTLARGLAIVANPIGLHWPHVSISNCSQGSWWQVVSTQCVATPEEASHFFAASGVILATAYAIRLSDLNHENIIACRGWPHVIDAEFIAQPSLALLHSEDDREAREQFEETVLDTLMLPLPGRTSDPSALGGATGSYSANGRWTPSTHLPCNADGTPYRPLDFLPEIIDGFTAAYQRALLSKQTLQALFLQGAGTIRIAIRPTQFYAETEFWLWSEPLLRLPATRRRAALVERLSASLKLADNNLCANIINSEANALLRGDIPLFHARPDSPTLFNEFGEALGQGFPCSPRESVRRRLAQLSQADQEKQASIIQEMLISVPCVGSAPAKSNAAESKRSTEAETLPS